MADLVQALTRGLVILEHLGDADHPLALREICCRAALKPPTAHNLLRTLIAHGFVERVEAPARYRLGPAAARLARQQAQRSLVRRIGEAMLELHEQFPEARFSFAEAVGGEVAATLNLTPEMRGRLQRGALRNMSPYGSASALLHQALWPAESRDAYRTRYPFSEYGGHLWRSLDRLDRYLDQVRDHRLAEPRFAHDTDYRVAAPVFDVGEQFVGALGAYLPGAFTNGADIDLIRDTLVAAANDLSSTEPQAVGADT